MPEAIPQLETPRLVLRAFRNADLDAYAAICADAEVMRYIGNGDTADRTNAWRQMAVFNGHWSLEGSGMWAVELKDEARCIGRIGLYGPPHWPGLELGWVLGRAHWGRGLAREGADAARRWAFEVLGCERLISLIRPDNVRSLRLAAALGAQPDGDCDLLGQTVLRYLHCWP